MANPTLTPFPTPPLPEQDEVTFNRNAANSLLAQANFVNEGNIVITWMGQQIDAAAASKKAAADSATAAGQSAESAATQAGNASTYAGQAMGYRDSAQTAAQAAQASAGLPPLNNPLYYLRQKADKSVVEWAAVTQVITKYFESTRQTILANSFASISHGLGVSPKIVSAYLICTSSIAGYAVGDRVEVSVSSVYADQNGSAGTRLLQITSDATNLYLKQTSTIFLPYRDTTSSNSTQSATSSNFAIVLRAFA